MISKEYGAIHFEGVIKVSIPFREVPVIKRKGRVPKKPYPWGLSSLNLTMYRLRDFIIGCNFSIARRIVPSHPIS